MASKLGSGGGSERISSSAKSVNLLGGGGNSKQSTPLDQYQILNSGGGGGGNSKGVGLLPQPLPTPTAPTRIPLTSSSSGGGGGGVGSVGMATSSNRGASNVPVTGAVRRLFSQQQQHQQAVSSGQGSAVFSSLLGPQPSSYLPLVNPAPSSTHSHNNPSAAKGSASQQALKQLAKSSSGGGVSTTTIGGGGGVIKVLPRPSSSAFRTKGDATPTLGGQSAMMPSGGSGAAASSSSSSSSSSLAKERQASIAKTSSQQSMYSSVINSSTANGGDLTPTTPQGPPTEVIEQPMQQIMRTPMLFHHKAASEIVKPKKKSTYSDAVGKKSESAMSANQGGVAAQGGVNKHPQPSVGGGGPMGGVTQGLLPPITTAMVPTQHKLNLAPGSRPVGVASSSEKVSQWQFPQYLFLINLGWARIVFMMFCPKPMAK